MDGICEFFCVVKCDMGDDFTSKDGPNTWRTFRWKDEYGNSIAPFFTGLECGYLFLKEINGWQLKGYPVSFVVQSILVDIKDETSFYAIDPESTEKFHALSPVQFLTALFYRKDAAGKESQETLMERPDIIPFDALFADGRDHYAELEYRRLMAVADLIFAIDVESGKQMVVYGKSSLEELVLTGKSRILGVVNVGYDQEPLQIEKLAALVQEIKGRHDYRGVIAI